MREGGNYFVILYKNSARCISDKDPKETGKELKDWAVEIAEKNLPKPELDKAKLKAEGFGPESHPEDPTTHTKMIT